jgi:hypothetical protein
MKRDKYFIYKFLQNCFRIFESEARLNNVYSIGKMSNLIYSVIGDLLLAKEESEYNLILYKLEEHILNLNLQKWYNNEKEFIKSIEEKSIKYKEIYSAKLFLYRFIAHCLMLITADAKEGGCNNTYMLSYIIHNIPLEILPTRGKSFHYSDVIKKMEGDLHNNGLGKWYEICTLQIEYDFSLGRY